MLKPVLQKNDKKANIFIITVSVVVFVAVAFLANVKFLTGLDLGFNVHVFALFNAIVNSMVSILLVWAFIAVRSRKYDQDCCLTHSLGTGAYSATSCLGLGLQGCWYHNKRRLPWLQRQTTITSQTDCM